jgi:AcrR family transcriptional regulator
LAEAGVSKGVAYYYFEDKADLFATLLEEAWADIAPLAPQPGEPLWPALHRMYRTHLDILRTRPWLAELNRQPPPPEVLARLAPIGAALHGIWEMVQAEGLRQDLPPALVAEMVQQGNIGEGGNRPKI